MKYLPHGTQVTFGSVPIGGLVTVGFPDAAKEEAETTDTDSAGAREFIPGLRDYGTVELSCRHDPEDPGQSALDTNFLLPNDIQEVVITLPQLASVGSGPVTYTFDAFVSAGPTGDLGLAESTAAEVGYSLRVTGPVTKVVPS